jgi:hypothetical protein
MRVIDALCAPGSALSGGIKRGVGDDRFGFDEAAGLAWVIDGATDVDPLRLFPHAESDAAWYAETLSGLLAVAPPADEPVRDYFARVLGEMRRRADAEARVAVADAPRSAWPTAAGLWARARDGRLEAASLGDAMMILRQPDGAVSVLGDAGKPAEEQARARRAMALAPAERADWLRATRALHNREDGYWVFGLEAGAAARLRLDAAACPAGATGLLMTDGFYRLVSPYQRHDPAGLVAAAMERGLGVLLGELRGLETSAAADAAIGRIKTSDDATAVLIEY